MLIINVIIISMSENWIPKSQYANPNLHQRRPCIALLFMLIGINIIKVQFVDVHFLLLIKPLQQLQQSTSTKSYRLTVLFSKNGNNCFIPIEFKSTGLKTNILSKKNSIVTNQLAKYIPIMKCLARLKINQQCQSHLSTLTMGRSVFCREIWPACGVIVNILHYRLLRY